MKQLIRFKEITMNVVSRSADDTNGSSKVVSYNVRRTEKGEKVITTTEVLVELELNEYLNSLLPDMKQDEPVKATLQKVMSDKFREEFKTHFWGEVCYSTAIDVLANENDMITPQTYCTVYITSIHLLINLTMPHDCSF